MSPNTKLPTQSNPKEICKETHKVVRKKTPKRVRPSIRHDAIAAADYLKYKLPYACEDCSHFNSVKENCTLGYPSEHHRKDVQKKSYELSGKMALCRFLEID